MYVFTMKWLKIILPVTILPIVLTGTWAYLFVFSGLPSIQELRDVEPTKLSKVTAADGTPIGYFPPNGMIILNGHNIPITLKQAFISAEDSTFYDHVGLEPRRILSALIADIRANSYVQGASTITQQVVRSYLLTREKTLSRKLKEIVLALRIEKALTKEQILNLYLDRIYLGSGAYGVQAGALRYFGKECRELELSEMTMLAGLAPAPTKYSPLNDFTAAKRRQWYVLTRMVSEGYITETEAQEAYKEPLRIVAKDIALFSDYPYITDYVKSLAIGQFGEDILSKGIIIRTTIVSELQRAATLAVRKGVIELEMRQGKYRGPVRNVSVSGKERIFAYQSNQLAWKGYDPYELYWAEVVKLDPLTVKLGSRRLELGPESYAWINPKGKWKPSNALQRGDLIQVCNAPRGFEISQQPLVQAAQASFDLEKSSILSLVGGVDYSQSQFNRVIDARRQSGSAIKPFIYAAAIDKGMTPASVIFDAPISYKAGADEEMWRPKNFENKYYGATTLRTGLVQSRNVVTIKILNEIGLAYAISYLKRFDLQSELPRNLSLALGSGVLTPINLFRGYATFATYGVQFNPHLIESIVQSGKGIIFHAPSVNVPAPIKPPVDASIADTTGITEGIPPGATVINQTTASPDEKRVISEQTAYILTNIMKDVVQEGTGWRAKALMRPVAGKTGTSNDSRDAWFVGYTPDLLCGVWVGYDNMAPLGENETGGKTACPIFVDFMTSALRDRSVRDFRVPAGVVFARVNSQTGVPSSDGAVDGKFEIFKEGSVPPHEKPGGDSDQLLKEVY
jgi:penicillin-binding protein 1A